MNKNWTNEVARTKTYFIHIYRCFIKQNCFCPAHADIYQMLTPREAEDSSKARPATMRTFEQSEKSQKTVKSMIEVKGGDKAKEPGGKKNKNTKKEGECCWRWWF